MKAKQLYISGVLNPKAMSFPFIILRASHPPSNMKSFAVMALLAVAGKTLIKKTCAIGRPDF